MRLTNTLRNVSVAVSAVLLFSCTATKPAPVAVVAAPAPPPPPSTPKVVTELDSASYAIGVQVATFYRNQGMDSVNFDLIRQAYKDVYTDSPLVLDLEVANMTLQEKLEKFMNAKLNKEKEKGKAFLDSIATRPNVVKLPSGLMYEIVKRGDGAIPKATDTVRTHYIGSLIDGKEFDNSYKRGEPLEFPVGGVIKGWVEALQLMPVGSIWKLYIPSELGYGDRGAGGAIPGGAPLVFTVELLGIVHK
ncbi:MAG: FKBP-type peptidyl-prolyl cis-trans isomerase [Chitinophagaceae bacterium]|nr:FKBP-type peptidyl-prolyl cis-trans isomerase [Chitinophagaceae bacterium]